MVATDEMQQRLGETTVTLYLTPGHTAGTVSTMIEVRDGGRSHLIANHTSLDRTPEKLEALARRTMQ